MASQGRISDRWRGLLGKIRNQTCEDLSRLLRGIYAELDSPFLKTKYRVPIPLSILRADRQTYNEVLTSLFRNKVLHLDIHATIAMEVLGFILDMTRMESNR